MRQGLVSVIGVGQQLHFENVVSRYYEIDSDRFAEIFMDFLKVLTGAGYTASAGFFYSILTSPDQVKDMLIQVFLPVNEAWGDDLPEGYRFQSYFQVTGLLATRVVGDEEVKFGAAVVALFETIVENGMKQTTPPFYVVTVIDEKVYTDVLVGVREAVEGVRL